MIAILPLVFLLQQGAPRVTATVSPPSGDTVGYWQQRADYRIAATLDEAAQVLHGKATLTYVNHSPDTLREMRVQQLLNAFRPGSRWSAADEREGRVRFQALKEPNFGYERFTRAPRVNGETRECVVSVRARQHDCALRAATSARAGRLGDCRIRVGCAAVRDRLPTAGEERAPLRLLAVVSESRGVRSRRLGGAAVHSERRDVRRVRHVRRDARSRGGSGGGRDGRAGGRRSGMGEGEGVGRGASRARRIRERGHRAASRSRGAKGGALLRAQRAPLRLGDRSELSLRGRALSRNDPDPRADPAGRSAEAGARRVRVVERARARVPREDLRAVRVSAAHGADPSRSGRDGISDDGDVWEQHE